jgi:hypothetical protein
MPKLETATCHYCDKPLGHTAFLWEEHEVCQDCYQGLVAKEKTTHPPAAPPRPPRAKVDVPSYWAISMVAGILVVLGFLQLLTAAIYLLLVVFPNRGTPDVSLITNQVVLTGTVLFAGILSIAGGQVLYCIRDMAINSFNLRRLHP